MILDAASLQAAIAACSEGDTLAIDGATLTNRSDRRTTIDVNVPGLTLSLGAVAIEIIESAWANAIFTISADGVTIDGGTITYSTALESYAAARLTFDLCADNCTVKNLTAIGPATGPYCTFAGTSAIVPDIRHGTVIQGNALSGQVAGIFLNNSDGALVAGNTFARVPMVAVQLYSYATNCTVSGNTIANDTPAPRTYGIMVGHTSTGAGTSNDNLIAGNTIADVYEGIFVHKETAGNVIIGNTVSADANGCAVLIDQQTDSCATIANNTLRIGAAVTDAMVGINCSGVTATTIRGNRYTHENPGAAGGWAMAVGTSPLGTIAIDSNLIAIAGTTTRGIQVNYANGGSIKDTTLSLNGGTYGIYLGYATPVANLDVVDCTCTGAATADLIISDASSNVAVYRGTWGIMDLGAGVGVRYIPPPLPPGIYYGGVLLSHADLAPLDHDPTCTATDLQNGRVGLQGSPVSRKAWTINALTDDRAEIEALAALKGQHLVLNLNGTEYPGTMIRPPMLETQLTPAAWAYQVGFIQETRR